MAYVPSLPDEPDNQQGGVFGRLTDPARYTGSSKHRFDEFGRGIPFDDRIRDLSDITRTYLRDTPLKAQARSRSLDRRQAPISPRSASSPRPTSARSRGVGEVRSPYPYGQDPVGLIPLPNPTSPASWECGDNDHIRAYESIMGRDASVPSWGMGYMDQDLLYPTSPSYHDPPRPIVPPHARTYDHTPPPRPDGPPTPQPASPWTPRNSQTYRPTPRRGNIFDRLTDPAGYTGTHKHRFDPVTGKGRGKEGRDYIPPKLPPKPSIHIAGQQARKVDWRESLRPQNEAPTLRQLEEGWR